MIRSVTLRTNWTTLALLLSAGAGPALAQDAQWTKRRPLAIAEQGEFYVGGVVVFSPATSSSGEGDPNSGHVVIDQVYVQYQIPARRAYRLPVILVHGSWHTGKTYGSTPDGREGWGTYFVRKGFATYIVDDVNRGRSSYDMTALNLVRLGLAPPDALPPVSQRTKESAWTTFRMGPAPGVPYPTSQFPAGAAEQYFAQLTDQYRAPVESDKRVAGLVALLDEVGPAIVVTHSSTGPIGWRAALARPGLVQGIVSVEPIALSTFTGFAALASVPVAIIRGDFDTPAAVAEARTFVANLRATGGGATFMSLPELGITGNGHMMMMERNNLELADLVIDWIARNVTGVRGRREH
jgi:pimeloyl-ACP methyl ester carboxylesterase